MTSAAYAAPPRLRTPRLALRHPRADDAQALFDAYCADARVTRFMTWSPHASVDDTRAFLARVAEEHARGTAWQWVLVPLDATGDATGDAAEPVGMVGLVARGPHRLELGYVLAHAWWGRGLTTEAARAVVDDALAQPGVWRVEAYHDVDNPASGRVMIKAGMAREGVLRRHSVHPNVSPEPRDAVVYARVRGS